MPVPQTPTRCTRIESALHELEALVAFDVATDGRSIHVAAVEDLLGERILHRLHDGALQRTRAERRLVADVDEAHLRRFRELEAELAIGDELLEAPQLDVDDAAQILLRQRAEDDDVVDAVQELRTKEVLELLAEDVA